MSALLVILLNIALFAAETATVIWLWPHTTWFTVIFLVWIYLNSLTVHIRAITVYWRDRHLDKPDDVSYSEGFYP